ncbi:MAG TPA: hypothetical protein VF789_31635 [Thermoanaerobaculia bacterium]
MNTSPAYLPEESTPGALLNEEELAMVKKAYRKPSLRRLGLLRRVTRFSF